MRWGNLSGACGFRDLTGCLSEAAAVSVGSPRTQRLWASPKDVVYSSFVASDPSGLTSLRLLRGQPRPIAWVACLSVDLSGDLASLGSASELKDLAGREIPIYVPSIFCMDGTVARAACVACDSLLVTGLFCVCGFYARYLDTSYPCQLGAAI